MKSAEEIKADVMASIQALRSIAVQGDESEAAKAAEALLEIANRSVGQVESLIHHPEDRHAPAALLRSAAVAASWPVSVPRVEEQRESTIQAHLPTTFGKESPVRIEKNKRGRPRKFDPASRTGFTHGIICDLIADGKFPIGGDADDIHFACLQKIEEDCMGNWENFPWPKLLKEDAESENHRGNPIKFMVDRWIKDGLKSLT